MSKSNLTVERLREVFDYNQETGLFTWKVRVAKCVHIGTIAGCIEKRIGYTTIGIDKEIYFAHRLAWLYVHGRWPDQMIDHINGKKSDNRFANLRKVTPEGNSQNVFRPNRRNKSGYMGVIFFQNKWRANISIKGKTQWLGDFDSPQKAHQVYLEAKRKHHAANTL